MQDFTRQAAQIRALIETHADAVDFALFGAGTSPEWIEKAQIRLGITFPASYVWWLKNYGGGQIYGDEVFSVYEQDFDTVSGGDIVRRNEMERRDYQRPPTQLVILDNDQGQVFYVDLALATETTEPPVYVSRGQAVLRYADDFFGFLSRQITEDTF